MSGTILMIHGMTCTGKHWRNYDQYFSAAGFTCLTPTLRFHDIQPGDSPDARLGTTGLLDYVEDLGHIVSTLYEPPILMGHSMGGLLAQILAARGRARALVLLNPAPPAGIWRTFNRDTMRAFRHCRWRWAFWKKPVRITFSEAAAAVFNCLPAKEQRELYDSLVYESGRAIFEIGLWFLDRSGTTRVDESRITCPTLVVGCAHDRITPAAVTRRIAAKYDHVATYREYAGHGHWVLGERGWEDVAGDVREWLESVPG